MSAEKTAPHLVKADLVRYLQLDELRKARQREASDLGKEQEALAVKIEEFVRARGGPGRQVQRSGFALAIVDKPGVPSWSKEFVRVCGEKAAAEVRANQPPRETLVVQRVA